MDRSETAMHATDCAEVRKLVYEFLDQELPADELDRISKHLARCSPCAGVYTFERAYLLVLKRRTTIEAAPADLRERIRAALASRERSGRGD